MIRRTFFRSAERRRHSVFILAVAFCVTNTALVPSAFAQQQQQNPTSGLDGAPLTTGPSQNTAANQSKNNNNSASQIAQQIGQSLLSSGTAMAPSCCSTGGCCSAAMMLIAMGLMGLAQSGANKSAAGQHGYNGSLNTSNGPSIPNPYNPGGNNPDSVNPSVVGGMGGKELADKLSGFGVKYDTKSGKFTMPNGKSFSTSDVMNPNAMANAGVSPSEYKSAMDMAKAAEKKAADSVEKMGALTAANGFDSGGSGGGSASSKLPPSLDEAGIPGAPMKREPTSVAGMVKNYNGEMIGVSGDNIFEMMARRYREKASKDNFLPPESSPDAISN